MAKHWHEFPLLKAPAPDDPKGVIVCKVSPVFVQQNLSINRKTPILQMWAHVIGELPPINNATSIRPKPCLLTLEKSVACFEGVNRPYNHEEDGKSVLVYVLEPAVSLAYQADLACVARAVSVPEDTVLTVQVCRNVTLQESQEGIQGVVTRLEFVSSVGDGPSLPVDHEDRYQKLHWKR